MSVVAQSFSINTDPWLIAKGNSPHDSSICLITASDQIYLGGPDVDSTDGFPFDETSGILSLVLSSQDDLYAVAGTTATVKVLRTRAELLEVPEVEE